MPKARAFRPGDNVVAGHKGPVMVVLSVNPAVPDPAWYPEPRSPGFPSITCGWWVQNAWRSHAFPPGLLRLAPVEAAP
jgi:hypothetical protein